MTYVLVDKKRLEYSRKFNNLLWITAKILFVIVVVIFICSLRATTINVNTQAIALVNTGPVLQSPLYTEDDKTSSQKAIFVNGTTHARELTFLGHGMAKGVNYTDIGRALIIPRGDGVIETKGQGAMITSGGKASFTFHEIGHSNSNGTITATGAAFFDTNATGKLAFLGNVVAVYKDQIYRDGIDKVIAWKWK